MSKSINTQHRKKLLLRVVGQDLSRTIPGRLEFNLWADNFRAQASLMLMNDCINMNMLYIKYVEM